MREGRIERGREERKDLSSTSWGGNLRQTVFEMHVKEAQRLLQIVSWQSINPENAQRVFFVAIVGFCVCLFVFLSVML